MRLSVWKYILSTTVATFGMPRGAEILCVREQGDDVCIWARVDEDETVKVARRFIACGTGHEAPSGPYVGTAHMMGGALIIHVFEELAQ